MHPGGQGGLLLRMRGFGCAGRSKSEPFGGACCGLEQRGQLPLHRCSCPVKRARDGGELLAVAGSAGAWVPQPEKAGGPLAGGPRGGPLPGERRGVLLRAPAGLKGVCGAPAGQSSACWLGQSAVHVRALAERSPARALGRADCWVYSGGGCGVPCAWTRRGVDCFAACWG